MTNKCGLVPSSREALPADCTVSDNGRAGIVTVPHTNADKGGEVQTAQRPGNNSEWANYLLTRVQKQA